MRKAICKIIISGGYIGYIPLIRGTLGTLEGLAIYLVLYHYLAGWYLTLGVGSGILFFTVLALALGNWAEQYYGQKDPSYFIIDEIAGFLIAVFMIKFDIYPLLFILLALVIFRFLDITKPFPIRRLQKLPGGLGMVIDDLMAGVYTNLLLQIIHQGIKT